MKKFAYITGALASILLLAGAFFKVMHWPGANICLIVGTVTLSMFFIPYFFYVNLKEQTEKKSKVVAAVGLTTALCLCAATLFKMMHWPGAMMMFVLFGASFLVFLPIYIMNGVRNPLTKVSTISNGFLFAAVGGFTLLLSFQGTSKAVNDSHATITENEKVLLTELRENFSSDSVNAYRKDAVDEFIATTDKALAEFDAHYENSSVGNGVAASPEDLSLLNNAIQTATDQFNANMLKGNSNWKSIPAEKLTPSLNGSLRFQVIQLQCGVCVKAINS